MDWFNLNGIKCALDTTSIPKNISHLEVGTDRRLSVVAMYVTPSMKVPVFSVNLTTQSEYQKDAHISVYKIRQGKLLNPEQKADPETYTDCFLDWGRKMDNKGMILMQRFELGRLLGQGTFAKVCFARNTRAGQSVAIKMIDEEKVNRVGMIDQIKRETFVMGRGRDRGRTGDKCRFLFGLENYGSGCGYRFDKSVGADPGSPRYRRVCRGLDIVEKRREKEKSFATFVYRLAWIAIVKEWGSYFEGLMLKMRTSQRRRHALSEMRTSQRRQHALWVEVREERETCRLELEKKKKVLARRQKELLKQEAQNDYEKKKFEDEKKQYAARDANLQAASMEQKKTDENLMKLCEDHKREKEGAHKNHKKLEDMQNLKVEIEKMKGKIQMMENMEGVDIRYKMESMRTLLEEKETREKEEAHWKVLDMQKTLEDKQNLEVEIKRLKGKKQMMEYMEGDDVRDQMQSMRTLLEEKETELDDLDQLSTTLLAKERIANDELQEARKEMIVGFDELFSNRAHIRVKRMGELDLKAFKEECKKKYPEDYEIKAAEIASSWDVLLRDPSWFPFKVVQEGDSCKTTKS
ncbi:protein INVOLVED IN DE NOVO 2-like [Nymphaea colorata]|nr:protein INVOLVED IN DE NOVO 2-like [Nymphaea colorata]